jgi:hypothetical protein
MAIIYLMDYDGGTVTGQRTNQFFGASGVFESDAQLGTSVHPKAIVEKTPCPFPARPFRTKLHTVAVAIGRCVDRISANLREPFPRLAVQLSPCTLNHNQVTPEVENSFLCGCMSHIQQLQRENHAVDGLDLQMASRSFREGAIWGLRTTYKESSNAPLDIP